MKNLRKTLLTLTLTTASVGGLACAGGAMTEDQTLVGEASSALTVAEQTGDVTFDAAGAESDASLAANGDDAAALPQLPADADGVCDLGARRARVIARYDVNGDGRLDATERAWDRSRCVSASRTGST